MRRMIFAALAAMVLAGCAGAIVESHPFAGADGKPILQRDGTPIETRRPDSDFGNGYPTVYPTYGLPLAYHSVTIKRDKDCSLGLSIAAPVYVRDPKLDHNFVIQYRHNAFADDALAVQTDDNGLLLAVNTTALNETPAIISQTLSLAGQVRQAFEAFTEGQAHPAATDCSDTVFNLQYTADLVNNRDGLQKLLPTGVHIDVKSIDAPAAPGAWSTNPAPNDYDGIYFRLNVPFLLTVCDGIPDREDCSKAQKHRGEAMFIAPSPEIYRIRIDRKLFTKYDVKLTFSHGVLTKFDSTDNSEVLAALQVPANLIKAILGLRTP